MTKDYDFDYDLIVIGSGASGSTAAIAAAREGKRVAIVEAKSFGGESPNYGDIPMKAFLHAANLYDEARHGARFGIRSATLGYNYPSIRAWKDLAIKRTGVNGNRRYYEEQGIHTYVGLAHFLSPNEISVSRRHLAATNFLVATGSTWQIPDIPGIQSVKYLTPETILDITRPPKSIVVIGGDDTGVEIAQLMATFGTKVHIIENEKHLLPSYDHEAGELIERLLSEQKGVVSLTSAEVVGLQKDGLMKRVIYSRGGVEKSLKVDEVVFADKRQPSTDIGLDNAGVKYSKQGICVNDFLQTSNKHIYAVGEVLEHSSNTHTAIIESQIAVNNIFHRNKISPDYSSIINIVFSTPNIAQVGFTEDYCKRHNIKIKKGIAPLNIIARSNTSDFRDGFVKIISDTKGALLGACLVAPHGSEIIHELALAIKCHLNASDIASMPHAFLSWNEAVRVAAGKIV